jgi:predicted peptidase
MRRLLFLFLAIALIVSARDTGFLNRKMTVGGTEFKYQVYVPENWTADQAWPVILFLHGAGERGADGLVQTDIGLAKAIRKGVERFPAIVVMPQCRKDIWWPDPQMEAQALAALDAELVEFHGDPDRVYLTGLSMGGYGTWALAAQYPERWAAIAPICGGIKLPAALQDAKHPADPNVDVYAQAAKKIGKIPAWIFHGDADPLVPVVESRRMTIALKANGGDVHYSEYPDIGHNSWDKAYAEPEFPKWLFAQRRVRKTATE